MKRLLIFGSIIMLLLMALAAPALMASTKAPVTVSDNKIKVLLNEKPLSFDVQPKLVNGRVLVPLRTVFQALGAKVEWDHQSQTITATKGRSKLKITLYQRKAYKNGQPITLDAPPIIQQGRTLVPLRFVAEALGTTVKWNNQTKTVAIDSRNLPLVSSQENLKALLAEVQNSQTSKYYLRDTMKQKAAVPEMKNEAYGKADAGAGYSATNVQVQGVDEADVIKTDGKYIYQINKGRIIIVLAYPAEKMQVIKTLNFEEKDFNPSEIYVDQKHLVVIGNKYYNVPLPENPGVVKPQIAPSPKIYPPSRIQNTAKILIYDISDKTNIKKIRETEVEGSYLSSRKIGSALYLVANKYIDYYYIMEQKGASLTPAYRDSIKKTKFTNVDYASIRYFPDAIEPNYLMIAGLNLDNPQGDLQLTTYLGSGQNVYASQNNLYLAVTEYQEDAKNPVSGTGIYKFALNQGQVKPMGKGKVPGTILNQFSMDEDKGYFRIATTTGEAWRNDQYTSKNNIYVLNSALKITGKIEDIAPGERIYSVRFMGDRGYLVTFKNVDPLFVIDLKEPQAPKILGSLKIPGYSDYLHPYDENHIIGFGKDTKEIAQKDGQGKDAGTTAFYLGMKIAIFDVSDVEHPVELFKELIGDRGTESELLHNHKALLFSKEKNLLAFPITVTKAQNKLDSYGIPEYGQFTFQGAYVYNINLVKGFTLREKITHLSQADLAKAGQGWYEGGNNVERIIFIGDTLYTLSQGQIKAHDLTSLKEIQSLPVPD